MDHFDTTGLPLTNPEILAQSPPRRIRPFLFKSRLFLA